MKPQIDLCFVPSYQDVYPIGTVRNPWEAVGPGWYPLYYIALFRTPKPRFWRPSTEIETHEFLTNGDRYWQLLDVEGWTETIPSQLDRDCIFLAITEYMRDSNL